VTTEPDYKLIKITILRKNKQGIYEEYKEFLYAKNMYVPSTNHLRKFFYYLSKPFQLLMDLCLGIDSGYSCCCIRAYLTNKKYRLEDINHILCYKCYEKLKVDKV